MNNLLKVFQEQSLTINLYNAETEMELIRLLPTYSKSPFEYDAWDCSSITKNKIVFGSARTVYFTKVLPKYQRSIKLAALSLLNKSKSISLINSMISSFVVFQDFYEQKYTANITTLSYPVVLEYQQFLKHKFPNIRTRKSRYLGLKILFKELHPLGLMPSHEILGSPYKSTPTLLNHEEKYIPKEVLLALDSVMKDESLPLYFRTIYWICRLIPSRVTEVCSMKLVNCIRAYSSTENIITIPMFKQNGGYIEGEERLILVENKGMGLYLSQLIERQKLQAEKIQDTLPEEKQGFLFSYVSQKYNPYSKNYIEVNVPPTIVNGRVFGDFVARICNRYDIQSFDGKRYIVTSHQLRHVGITDRLYAGFRPIDIMSMTHHKSEKMIQNSYLHINESKLKEHALSAIGEEKREVLFRGRIINSTDDKRWEMILKKPLAHSIGRLGICSDISDCQCDMYECLNDCPYFAINAENLPYFEEELASWKKKEALYLRLRKTSALENARHNIILFEKNIKLIKDTLKENDNG